LLFLDDREIFEAILGNTKDIPGYKHFTIVNNFRPIEDNDYVNFNVTEKPIDPVPHIPENNSTPTSPVA
jgi:hypothetical protein